MSQSSLETQWQAQSERHRRIANIVLFLILIVALLLFISWFWLTQPLLSRANPNLIRTVDPSRLEAHVRKLSVALAPRDEAHVENLDSTAAYIKAELALPGANVYEQPYRVDGKSYQNVIAEFGPKSTERIIVGAHYDTCGPLPGADDNASGVGGLLELGRLLSNHPPAMRVELVAYSLEEPPYFRTTGMGSSVHAESMKKQHVKIKAMFSLEMIGFFNGSAGTQHFPSAILGAFYPNNGNFISVVGRPEEGLLVRKIKAAMRNATPLPVYSINAPVLIAGIDFSDQLNYWHAGYSAVMITDTAFYRNPNYHTSADTAEKLDYKRMAMVVEGVYAAVMSLASN